MHLTRITSAKKNGFSKKQLRTRRDPPGQTVAYMKQRSTFLIAVLSLVAFGIGNLAGEHGFRAFYAAVFGQFDDSLITYSGTVSPIALVPDYAKWSTYGGSAQDNTFRQVPSDVLMPLPAYSEVYEKTKTDENGDVYSVGYMGDYATGQQGRGSHPGVDIRVPIGTPVRSIANGIVEAVSNDANGFGMYIVIRHPHMPDPANLSYETVLHSGYAHLSAQLVTVGDTVQKGQLIGYSGKTGDATGPHLHFQIDRDTVVVDGKTATIPWHPFWPFTGADLRQAALSEYKAINAGFHQSIAYRNTVNPVLYTQSNYPVAMNKGPVPIIVASVVHPAALPLQTTLTLAQRSAQRRADRLPLAGGTIKKESIVSTTQSPIALGPAPVVIVQPQSSSAASSASSAPAGGMITGFELQSSARFTSRSWTTVRIRPVDENGNTADTSLIPAKLYLSTTYGSADFQTAFLTPADFSKDGTATFQMLPRGDRTVVVYFPQLGVGLPAMTPVK